MKALELFGCSGGMAEGFRRAGITFDWAFDYSKEACDSYEANLGHRPVQMNARDLLRLVASGWRPTESLDLVVADPPCTPWSRAGKRLGVADERDMLGVTCELIRLLRPRAYLIGNVPDHPESGSILSQPNAVALSERAGLILQGLPEDWKLLAPTKTGRWSMLGQAMPPALSEAVARSVAEQIKANRRAA